MEPLNEYQIRNNMSCYTNFLGVFAADEMPRIKPGGIIVNTDDRNKPGMHWIAIFIDRLGNGEFFDSYGLPPWVDSHISFMKRCKRWRYNRIALQSLTSSVCGHYCMLFLDARSRGISMNKFLKQIKQRDKYSNDAKAYIMWCNKFHIKRCRKGGQTCCCKHQLQSRVHHGRYAAGGEL